MGLRIDQVQLKNVNPPQTVQASFNQVNQAQQEKERAINMASGEYNKVVPRATGEADQKIMLRKAMRRSALTRQRGTWSRSSASGGIHQGSRCDAATDLPGDDG